MRRLARQTEPDEVPEEITFPEKDKNGEDLVVQQSREKNDEEEVPRELGKAKKSPQQKLLDQAQRQRELKLNSRVGLFDAAEEKKRPIIASAPYRSMADRIEEARARRDTLLMNRVEMELEKRQRETGEIDDRQANESPL
jgi:phage protein D